MPQSVALRSHRFFLRCALCPPTPSPISFLQKAELPSTLASTTAVRSGPQPLLIALRGFSLRPFGVLQAIRNLLPKKFNLPENYNEIAATALASTGFHHVSQIGELRGYSTLLSALVERWRPETYTFHLPVGVTGTLEDVIHILGLAVNREPVTGRINSSHG
ncbi:uncharacterized protein [Arachis hypogaea]|uniref:uncharacterized protein n=1 Tax=Arachis hypogaea TaxID=3818 RepID=UPI0007AF92AD|nr:uncharacterized protein LOC112733499 [Arachis hypogaea]